MVSHAVSHGFPVLRPSCMPRFRVAVLVVHADHPLHHAAPVGQVGFHRVLTLFERCAASKKKARICQQKRVGNDETSSFFLNQLKLMEMIWIYWVGNGVPMGLSWAIILHCSWFMETLRIFAWNQLMDNCLCTYGMCFNELNHQPQVKMLTPRIIHWWIWLCQKQRRAKNQSSFMKSYEL